MLYHPYLKTFQCVADCGSFSKASELLHASVVAIMKQINSFEDEIGVKLFHRSNRGVALTAAGQSLYKDAAQIVNLCEEAIVHAQQIARSEQRVVRIGTSHLRSCKPLFDLIGDVSDNGRFDISIIPFSDEPKVLQNLLNSLGMDIDLFVGPCSSYKWKNKYNILQLGYNHCDIAVPKRHRLAKHDKLEYKDLYHESLVLLQRGFSPDIDCIRDDIEQNHPQIKIIDTPDIYDTSVFNRHAKLNHLLEIPSSWDSIHPGYVTKTMNWPYTQPWGIIYSLYPSLSMKEWIQYIHKQLK